MNIETPPGLGAVPCPLECVSGGVGRAQVESQRLHMPYRRFMEQNLARYPTKSVRTIHPIKRLFLAKYVWFDRPLTKYIVLGITKLIYDGT